MTVVLPLRNREDVNSTAFLPARSRSGPARAAKSPTRARHGARPLAYACCQSSVCARFIRAAAEASKMTAQNPSALWFAPAAQRRDCRQCCASRFAERWSPNLTFTPKIRHERPLLTRLILRPSLASIAHSGGIACSARPHVASVRALVIITPTQPLAPTMTMRIATCAYYLERREIHKVSLVAFSPRPFVTSVVSPL